MSLVATQSRAREINARDLYRKREATHNDLRRTLGRQTEAEMGLPPRPVNTIQSARDITIPFLTGLAIVSATLAIMEFFAILVLAGGR